MADHGLSLEGPPPAPDLPAADPKSLPPAVPRSQVEAPPVATKCIGAAPPEATRRTLLGRWVKLRIGQGNTSWLASLVVHAVLLLVMALIVWRDDDRISGHLSLLSSPGDPASEFGEDALTTLDVAPPAEVSFDVVLPLQTESPLPLPLPFERHSIDQNKDPKPRDDPPPVQPQAKWRINGGFVSGGGLEGRLPAARARLGKRYGATDKSESAVELGLAWIAAHQRRSGGWRFQHNEQACAGRCRNPGSEATTTGATGLALLSFLGAGYTQQRGKYREVVNRGFYYLSGRMLLSTHGGDLQEGTMYAQGIATMALCEAFAMTGDEALRGFAQKGIDFIVYAQNKKTGGWRYLPGQPGDTIVLGWQLMALRSGSMAGLDVPPSTVYRARRFLDSVQSDGGAFYGYQSVERRPTATAVGLLSRMVTGWKSDRAELVRGAEYLTKRGPSQNDLYYNYYASQVLHHADVPAWRVWNRRMQKRLVATQARSGHERGSWYFTGGHAQSAGRLYYTAMAVMTLEVYYRYLPLYTDAATTAGQ